MAQWWTPSLTCTLIALIATGCATEKAPPSVAWVYPQSAVTVESGEALRLKFTATDPAPERGSTEAAAWRVTIGTESGTTWWTTSGTLSAVPENTQVSDTIEITWQVPSPPSGSSGTTVLLLSAICTDGEGQTGADFGSLHLTHVPLTSDGIWWTNGTDGFGFANPQLSAEPAVFPGPDSPQHLVFLDGEDLMVSGGTEARGWPLTDGIPSEEPTWSFTPSATTTGSIRYVRRAPFEHTNSAWAEIGWPDRCTWLNANGTTLKTWLLNTDEELIDARSMANQMVILARTDAHDLRLIRFNLDNTSRLESVTWTPQATGSMGPEGQAWLVQKQEFPAALETDGTLRVWNPNGGATPLSSLQLDGNGVVKRAGPMEGGKTWADRNETFFYDTDLSILGTWDGPVYSLTADRTTAVTWLLSGNVEAKYWQALTPSFEAQGSPIPAGSGATSGSVAHNRPGPI